MILCTGSTDQTAGCHLFCAEGTHGDVEGDVVEEREDKQHQTKDKHSLENHGVDDSKRTAVRRGEFIVADELHACSNHLRRVLGLIDRCVEGGRCFVHLSQQFIAVGARCHAEEAEIFLVNSLRMFAVVLERRSGDVDNHVMREHHRALVISHYAHDCVLDVVQHEMFADSVAAVAYFAGKGFGNKRIGVVLQHLGIAFDEACRHEVEVVQVAEQ